MKTEKIIALIIGLTFFGFQAEENKEIGSCILSDPNFLLPKIRQEIGDTINIDKTYKWLLTLKSNETDKELNQILNRGYKFFQIFDSRDFAVIGFLEDEGEYLGIYIYSIDKINCQILSNELIAETTAWENGYKETFSIFTNEYSLKRIKNEGSKDFGDGTKWNRGTTISEINFNNKGQIIAIEK